jgi:hypothetical protein
MPAQADLLLALEGVGVIFGWFMGLWFTVFILIASLLVGVLRTHPALPIQR